MKKHAGDMLLSLSALQYTVGELSLFDALPVSVLNDIKAKSCDGGGCIIKKRSPCRYLDDGGRVCIIYDEKDEDERYVCQNEITLEKGGGCAVITKKGRVLSSFRITEGCVETAEYITELGAFELGTLGVRLASELGRGGGVLHLDYISEIRGCDAQRIKMRIEIIPV